MRASEIASAGPTPTPILRSQHRSPADTSNDREPAATDPITGSATICRSGCPARWMSPLRKSFASPKPLVKLLGEDRIGIHIVKERNTRYFYRSFSSWREAPAAERVGAGPLRNATQPANSRLLPARM